MSRFLRLFSVFVVVMLGAFYGVSLYSATNSGSTPSTTIYLDDDGAKYPSVPSTLSYNSSTHQLSGLPLISVPYKPGYLYAGHFTEPDCSGYLIIKHDGSRHIDRDVTEIDTNTLYACWVPAIYLNYKPAIPNVLYRKVFVLNGNGSYNAGSFVNYIQASNYQTATWSNNGNFQVRYENRGDWVFLGYYNGNYKWLVPSSTPNTMIGPLQEITGSIILDGYDFGGYYENMRSPWGAEVVDSSKQLIDANLLPWDAGVFSGWYNEIYAKWNPGVYTVYLSGSGVSPSTVYLKYGVGWYDTLAHAQAGGTTGRLSGLTTPPSGTSGQVFGGYYAHSNLAWVKVIEDDGQFIMSQTALTSITTNGTTLTPSWNNSTWATLTINDMDEQTATQPKPLYYSLSGCPNNYYRANPYCSDQQVTQVSIPQKVGWVYYGHYDGIGGAGNQYINSIGVIQRVVHSDANIYAKWLFNVSYAAGTSTGGSAPVSPNVCTYGVACNAPQNTYTNSNTGMTFAGWACTIYGGQHNGTSCGTYLAGQDLSGATSGKQGATGIILTATWVQSNNNYYKLTLNPNGGSNTSSNTYIYERYGIGFYKENNTTYPITASIFAPLANGGAGIGQPTNGTQVFDGYWTTINNSGIKAINENGIISVGSTQFSGATNLYAHWLTPQQVSLRPGQDGDSADWGTCDLEQILVVPGHAPLVNPLSCGPTWSGHTFLGYYDVNGTQYYDGNGFALYEEWPANGPEGLFGHWAANTYTVNYSCTEGGAIVHTDNVASGAPYTVWDGSDVCNTAATSSAPGSKLTRWATSGFFGATYNPGEELNSFNITGNMNLKGNYSNIYVVNLDHMGNTPDMPLTNVPSPDTVYYAQRKWYSNNIATDQITQMDVAPEKIGYNFSGYRTQNDGGTNVGAFNNSLSSDVITVNNSTIYAYWQPMVYEIRLNPGAGNGGAQGLYYRIDKGWDDESDFILPTNITAITPPSPPTGKRFVGYYTMDGTSSGEWGTQVVDGTGTIQVNGIVNVANMVASLSNGTIYAQYGDQITPPSNPNDYFAVTTTALAAGDTFTFGMSAEGTFYVDWDDGTIELIDRSGYQQAPQKYSHTYTSAAQNGRTIKIWGTATGYKSWVLVTESDAISFGEFSGQDVVNPEVPMTPELVAGISGSLGAVFPTLNGGGSAYNVPGFNGTFYGCTNLTGTIPYNLFDGITGNRVRMFMNTFRNTGLTGISGTSAQQSQLFSGITGAAEGLFYQTFAGASITSIPENLFSGITGAASDMFRSTFAQTNITSIPENLFGGVTGAAHAMFYLTFSETGITSIPENLFGRTVNGSYQGVSGAADWMFAGTFSWTNITSIPANLFGRTVNGSYQGVSGAAEHMFTETFAHCSNLTSLPSGVFRGVTGTADNLFSYTFSSCAGLAGKYIPKDLFNLGDLEYNANNDMMLNVFLDTDLVTNCADVNLTHYSTDYDDSYWGGKKVCAPAATFSCALGPDNPLGSGSAPSPIFWDSDAVTSGSFTLPADAGCVAPEYWTKTNNWTLTVNNVNHYWPVGSAFPGTSPSNSGITWDGQQSINFYMSYQKNIFSVALNKNHNDAQNGSVTTLYEVQGTRWSLNPGGNGEVLSLAPNQLPTHGNLAFDGYYDDPDEGEGNLMVAANGDIVASNTTLTDNNQTWYAHWTTSNGPFTVTFSCGDDGSWASGVTPSTFTPQSNVYYNDPQHMLTVPAIAVCTHNPGTNNHDDQGYTNAAWECNFANSNGLVVFGENTEYTTVYGYHDHLNCVPSWVPVEKTITLDPQLGSAGTNDPWNTGAGTSTIYTRYGVGVYRDADRTEMMEIYNNGLVSPNYSMPGKSALVSFNLGDDAAVLEVGTSAYQNLGTYNTLAALQAAHPTAQSGNYALVGNQYYTWSGTGTNPGWYEYNWPVDPLYHVTVQLPLNGYYNSSTGGTKMIYSNGLITSDGANVNTGGPSYVDDSTWYAQWEPVNLNKSHFTDQNLSNGLNDLVPTRSDGKLFVGWWTTPTTGGHQVTQSGDLILTDTNELLPITQNITLYARWADCNHTLPADSHSTKTNIASLQAGYCSYHITCDAAGYGYSQGGGNASTNPNNYNIGEFDVSVPGTSGSLEAGRCYPRVYGIDYGNLADHNATMPGTEPTSYLYGTGTEINANNATPTSPTDVFESWCWDAAGTDHCNTTQTISNTAYGDKVYYAKWSNACQPGYERLNHDVMMSQVYDNNSWHYAVPNYSTWYLDAGTCVPKIYHVRCNKNCDDDTCVACLEDFVMDGYNWHLGGGYNVKDFCFESSGFTTWNFGGFTPVRARVSGDPENNNTNVFFNCTNGTGIEPNYIWLNSYYIAGGQSSMLSRLYSNINDYNTGNYNHLLQSLSGSTNTPSRSHYTFDGLWTEPDGGIPYINANGNFANGNGTAYNKVPWPSYGYNNYDARAFQNFFFDNGITESSSPVSGGGRTFDVYAHWIPDVYEITLDKNGGSWKTGSVKKIYEKWNTSEGWSKNGTDYYTASTFNSNYALSSSELPTAPTTGSTTGYNFGGYWTNNNCNGTKIIGADGKLVTTESSTTGTVAEAKYFGADSTLYACWTPKQQTITLDRNLGGAHGTSSNKTIYTKYATGVYKNSARTQKMTATNYPVSPVPERYWQITYHPNYPSAQCTGANQTVNAESTFLGYFKESAATNTDKYINGNTVNDGSPRPGYITPAGDSAGQSYTANKTWYAHWGPALVNLWLPQCNEGYVFKGWYDAATNGNLVGNWSLDLELASDRDVYAHWEACNWTQGDHSTASYTTSNPDDGYYNVCTYHIECESGYTYNGLEEFDYHGNDSGVENGNLPGCSATGYTITYKDNPAYYNGNPDDYSEVMYTESYSYDPDHAFTLWTPGSNKLSAHRASSVQWCDINGNNCKTQLAAGETDDKVFYAKWTCDTGYRTYAYNTWSLEFNASNDFFAAGMCAPARYRVMCNKNCPSDEPNCKACLEDFNLLSSNTVGKYNFGFVYNSMALNKSSCGDGWSGDLVPTIVYSMTSNPAGNALFTQSPDPKYAQEPCWLTDSRLGNDALAAYVQSGNYKDFVMALANMSYNNGINFGATHYDFNGLWTHQTSEDDQYKYIRADGLSSTGGSAFTSEEMSNKFTSDTNVYAHWEPKEYTINLDTNTGGGSMSGSVVTLLKQKWKTGWKTGTSHDGYVLAENFQMTQAQLPTQDGYEFKGYYTEQQSGTSCSGTQIIMANGKLNTAVSDISNASYFDNENGTTIYACWELLGYNISYVLNGGSAGTDAPTSATYGQVIHVDNPVNHPHGTFRGWTISNMQNEIQHWYGPTNPPAHDAYGTTLNLVDDPNMVYFKDLRKNNNATVLFTANWECVYPYQGPSCDTTGGVTVTVIAGNGIASVNGGNGWSNNGSGTITGTFAVGTSINLADFATAKTGYTGRAYVLSGAGTLSGGTFTVGDGDAVITINATGITTPSATISGGATKVYNHQNVTLTASNSVAYDSNSITLSYQFVRSDTENGTYTNVTSSGNTYSVSSSEYHGTKYYKVKITASGEGSLVSSEATSATPVAVTLKNAPVTFNVNGGTLDGNSPLYVPYNLNGNLYSTANSEITDTPATVPGATRDNYNLVGWFSQANGGVRIYDGNGNLQSNINVPGVFQNNKWVVTDPNNGATLHAFWEGKVYEITLNKNNGTGGDSEFYEKYATGYASSSNANTWNKTQIELPTRTGYDFAGYYANSSFTGAVVIDTDGLLPVSGSSVNSTYFTADTNLYAKWTAKQYNISYNFNGGSCSATNCPRTAKYGSTVTINNPTAASSGNYHQTAFAGWDITGMESGITHYYGETSASTSTTATELTYETITPSIKKFKNLRADTDTVYFTARWVCEEPYQQPSCSTLGAYTITVQAHDGISKLSVDGWNGSGTSTITKTFNALDEIDLSTITVTRKNGYTGTEYVKASGEGTLSGNTFTVGGGDATIYVNATGITPPSVTLSATATSQIYNYQDITLTAGNSVQYDDSISLSYEFAGPATSSSGSWEYVSSEGNTKTVAKNAYLGTRYYRARITATANAANGGFTATGTSASKSVALNQKKVTFNPNGGTLDDTGGRYIRYDSASLYNSATGTTTKAVPIATLTGHEFAGYYTAAENGDQIYKSNRTLASTAIDGWIGDQKWRSTEAKTVYAHWTPKILKITLNQNNGTGGTAEFYEKYGVGYALTSNATNWGLTEIVVPTLAGYDFQGYYANQDFTGDVVIGTDGKLPMNGGVVDPTYFTANTTLYAKWSAKTYNVVYNCGGHGNGSTDIATYDGDYTVKTLAAANCDASVAGATFGGWAVTPANDTVQPGDHINPWHYTANQTFTAIWTNDEYTLTYSCGTGTGTPPASWTGYYGGSITVSGQGSCAKTGHIFTGWAVTPAGGTQQPGPIQGGWPYTANQTFTAQWTADEYDIYYDENGGTRTLPVGNQVEYIKNAASTYVQTGIIPDVDDVEINVRFYQNGTGNTLYLLQSRATSGGTIFGISGSQTGSKISATWNGSAITSTITRVSGHIYTIKARFLNGVSTLYVRDETAGTEETITGTYTFAVPTAQFGLFGNTGGNRISGNQRVYSASIKVNGAMVMDYVPVTNNGTAGFYDVVSGNFKGAYVGSLSAGDAVTYPEEYTYGVGAKVYGIPVRANSVFVEWCQTETSSGTLSHCQSTPFTISTTATGDKTLHAKWECKAGYTQSGDKQSCVANTIILDWQENNGSYADLPNGQCTYGGNLTLPGAPANDPTAWVFNGWKTYGNSGIFAANASITGGCTETYTGVTSGTSTDITAQWCPACSTTNASCTPDMSVPGTCSYETHCNAGYHLDPNSQLNVYNTVCIPYTITYQSDGHGDGATDEVPYNSTFTTNDAKNLSQFNWDNHIVTAWTTVSGGSFPNVGGSYTYNVQSDTVLKANWGECHCTLGDYVTNCVTTSSNNACEVSEVECETGHSGGTGSCEGLECTSTCGESYTHMIRLIPSPATDGTRVLYAIDTNGGTDAGVYLDASHQQRMTENDNHITLPTPVTRTVTYDKNANDAVLVGNTTAQTSATFNGYYNSTSGTEQYIAATGYITSEGITEGTEAANHVWSAQWTNGTVVLPYVYRPGYKFLGWFTATGTTPVGQCGDTYSVSANPTLYAHWELCADGEYCPGVETVNNLPVYNVVHACPGEYVHSVSPRNKVSDCYLNLTGGEWVETTGQGTVDCTQNYYCDEGSDNNHPASPIYYSDETNDGRRTTGGRKSCAADAGSTFSHTVGTGASSINQCYKEVTLNKRGGSGNIPNSDGTMASGTNSATRWCSYGTNCTFPSAANLQKAGYVFSGGWTDVADTDCDGTTLTWMPDNDIDTYYACRMPATYNNVKLRNGRFTSTIYATIAPTYLQAMPSVDTNGNTLTVPTYSDPDHPETTYVFQGYFDGTGWTTSSGTKYYNVDMTSAHDWDKTTAASLYAKFYMRCNPGYYLPAGKYYCEPCPAGRYCTGGSAFSYNSTTDKGLSGYIAAGYYSTGGASTSKPSGHVTSGNGCYGQIDSDGNGTMVDTACGLVAGGYYSTGRGTSATPTAAGDGCLSGATCGKLGKLYFSSGGGTTSTPTGIQNTGCVSGQTCGKCPDNYQSSTVTGKTAITQCTATCNPGTQVETAETVANNPTSPGCTTPNDNDWWSGPEAHSVAYGSASPVVNNPTNNGVHACATDYNTPNTFVATDHNERADCARTIALSKNGGSGIIGDETDPDESPIDKTCFEGLVCNFGDPSVLQQPGWNFLGGWGTTDSCSDSSTQSITTPTESTYYACKNHIPYTLTYACGDGANGTPPASWTGYYGDLITVSGQGNCAKTGHTFTGWAVTPAGGTQQPGPIQGGWPYTADQTFTAQWTADTYHIYYQGNGGVVGSILPDGYTELEYIQSDGNQYIRTNFIPSSDFKHTIVFEGLSGNSNTYIAGTNSGAAGRAGNVRINGNYINAVYGNNASDDAVNLVRSSAVGAVSILNKKSVLVLDLHNNATNSMTLNGVQIANTSTARITSTSPMSLFALSSSYRSIIRLYRDTIEQNGVVVHNYVPARNSNNELGLYDTVTGEFFTNQGSGTFVAGDPVIGEYPNQYTYGVGATVTGGAARANSVFQAWCRTASLTECAAPHEITTTDTGDITLYAKWGCVAGYHDVDNQCVANEFTLVYNKNGHGTETTPANQTCTYGQQINLADDLSETGWWFNGWTIAGETYMGGETITCNEEYLGVTGGTVNVNVNAVADWSAKCNKITLNKNNSGASNGTITALYAKTRENGSPDDGKWYKNSTCTTEYTSADYANVIPTRSDGWTFRGFYANLSDAADINATQTNGANRVITHTGEPTSITGQNFINNLNAPATLYAGWAKDCAGVNGTCVRTLGTNTSYTTSCATGYHYGTAPNGVTYNPATNGNTSESTYYPNCVPNTITIILDKNGGAGTCGGATGTTAGTLTCEYNGTCNTPTWTSNPTCRPSQTGKIFNGWNTAADGTGTQYGTAAVAGDAQNINDGTTTTTLYAVWKDAVCNVTNGSATISIRGNQPYCRVTCDTGYEQDGVVQGQQHEWVVDTGQCNASTYDIDYELYGGSRVEPNGYTLLEYVTADGNQYFDTGVAIKKSYEIRSRFKPTATDKFIYGVRNTNDTASVTAYTANWRWGNKTVSVSSLINLNNVYNAIQNVNGVTLNGTTTAYAAQDADFTTPNTLVLGTARTASGTFSTYTFVGNIYEFRILDGNRGDLMNLVPMMRNSDGVAGLYDTVSGEFFTSTSGTAFIAGPRVLSAPEGYTFFDYIESDGNQKINTGIMGLNKRVVLDAQYTGTSVSSYKIPVGYNYDYLGTYLGVYSNQWAVYSGQKTGTATNRTTVSVVFDMNSEKNRATFTVGGTTKTYTRSNTQSDGTLKLFSSRSASGAGTYGFIGRIYSAKIYDKDTNELLFDGVPARRNSDGALGMYDRVSSNFFPNIADGTFTVGPEIDGPYPEHYTYGIGANVYGVPVRANSVFEGWCRNAELTDGCTMVPHAIAATETGDKLLHAKWSCVDGYHLDGHDCVGNSITIDYQKGEYQTTAPNDVTQAYGTDLVLAGAMYQPGYDFVGWLINGVVYEAGATITLDYDTLGAYNGTVVALAQRGSSGYVIKYNCNTTWTPNTPPANGYVYTGDAFTPAANTCLNPGYSFVGWRAAGQSTNWVPETIWPGALDPSVNPVTFYAQWQRDENSAFTVTVDMPANTEFKFKTIATGQFWVDWGDNSSVEEYTPTTITTKTWTHTYTTAGTYVVKIGGRATGYAVSADGTPETKSAISFFNGTPSSETDMDATVTTSGTEQYITKVSGKLGAIFPTISAGTWGGQPRFYRTFKNTTAMNITLQSIADVFDGVNGIPVHYMFAETFDGSAVTGAIPAGLFPISGAVKEMLFLSTFRKCTGLTGTIPDLFASINGAPKQYMFSRTFRGCTNLTGIPAGLFRGISGAPATGMFMYTFYGCTNITGTLSSNLFGTLNGPVAKDMFRSTFYNCTSLVGDASDSTIAIPAGLFGQLTTSTTAATSAFRATFYGCQSLRGKIGNALFGGLTGSPAEYMFSNTFNTCGDRDITTNCSNLNGAIPTNLFGNMTGAPKQSMFNATFKGASKLTGAIPSKLFGTITGAPATSMFKETFKGCSGLTGIIPANLFENISGLPAGSMFYSTFYGCSHLSGIGGALFSGISGRAVSSMFFTTFYNCSGLTGSIPAGLFGTPTTPANWIFSQTFYGCSGLTGEIPSGLFGSVSGPAAEYMFDQTFRGCSGLTGTIPSDLFGTLSNAGKTGMFRRTFYNCSHLTGYVPEGLFGTMTVPSDVPTDMMTKVFAGSGLDTVCPCGTTKVDSDFETYWDSTTGSTTPKKVSCRVGLKPGEHWYNGNCTTECSDTAIDELHVGNLNPYIVLADPVSTVKNLAVKHNDTICYVPVASGNGGASSLNMKYGNTVYHADRPNDTPPAGFGQR